MAPRFRTRAPRAGRADATSGLAEHTGSGRGNARDGGERNGHHWHVRHPGPPNTLDGDGAFVGPNAGLRPLAYATATACANAFQDAGFDVGRVTCSQVSTRPPRSGGKSLRGVIRALGRNAVSFVLEVDSWPVGPDQFEIGQEAGIEFRIRLVLEHAGLLQGPRR